ncbi:MAG: LLM class flavin-dependent oxidoreductase [Porticoccaceae bacterium]
MKLKIGVASRLYSDPGGDAREIERLGYDYFAAGEHVAFNVPASNSFISLAAAAGATTRIRLINAVAQVPVYPAALLAKLSAALDVASAGRFELGVGVGGEYPDEYEACGVPVRERGARTDEALEVITRLLREDDVSFAGRFNRMQGITIDPKPVQTPLPLWVSGRKDVAMRRAARRGSGWLPYMYTPEMVQRSLETIAAQRSAELPPIEAGLLIWGAVHSDAATARQMVAASLQRTYDQDFNRFVDAYCFAGTPEQVISQLTRHVAVGVRTIILSFACPEPQVNASRSLFTEHVLPALRAL